MGNAITEIPKKLTTPGIGMAGMVMCPYFKGACLKNGCELWVELNTNGNFVGRCTLSWQSVLMTELRMEIEKARKGNKK